MAVKKAQMMPTFTYEGVDRKGLKNQRGIACAQHGTCKSHTEKARHYRP